MLKKAQKELLERYKMLVLEANKKMNLTAITEDEDFDVKHIADSLTLLPWLPKAKKNRSITVADIGTGAGFPGVVLKVARPDIRLMLLDSTRKKIAFVASALESLGIAAECLHARAEALPRLLPGVEFDIVTARAVASLDKLIPWALPLVTPGGRFIAMKGPGADEELEAAAGVMKKYNAVVEAVEAVEIAPGVKRVLVVIKRG
jgi:16S rRNA (guanine527-N7)-methyltransferase